jgi:hypothetical protein
MSRSATDCIAPPTGRSARPATAAAYLVAHEAIEHAARLLRVHEVHVEFARPASAA